MDVYEATQTITQAVEQSSTQCNNLELAAFILSIISLVLTILVGFVIAVYEVKSSKKLYDISLESSYFNDLYKDYLLIDLPKHRKVITFSYQGKLIGTEDLLNGLKDIRENSLYYYYTDKHFYDKLKACVQDLEDYITITEDKVISGVDQFEVHNDITNKIKELYGVMTAKCFNGKAGKLK